MSSDSEASQIQSILNRLIRRSQNSDFSLFLPFLLGLTGSDPDTFRSESGQTETDPDHNSGTNRTPDGQNQRERIILINPLTQGMVVIEGTGVDTLFRAVGEKNGPPPASKSSIEGLPSVVIREDEGNGECAICLDEWVPGEVVKEMPCKHRFHCGCIDKWLGLHGSCPVCRFVMPVEDGEPEKKGREDGERGRREIWVSFSLGSRRRDGEGNGDENSEDN